MKLFEGQGPRALLPQVGLLKMDNTAVRQAQIERLEHLRAEREGAEVERPGCGAQDSSVRKRLRVAGKVRATCWWAGG
ncbi:MAG: hypothetical protein Q9Q40_09290 [Acidobacteriota bacterium]|nr:hypothetical protein [Acidobacteriota bacterium]